MGVLQHHKVLVFNVLVVTDPIIWIRVIFFSFYHSISCSADQLLSPQSPISITNLMMSPISLEPLKSNQCSGISSRVSHQQWICGFVLSSPVVGSTLAPALVEPTLDRPTGVDRCGLQSHLALRCTRGMLSPNMMRRRRNTVDNLGEIQLTIWEKYS